MTDYQVNQIANALNNIAKALFAVAGQTAENASAQGRVATQLNGLMHATRNRR